MSLSQVHYLPLAPPFFFILVGLFVALLVLIQLGVLRYAYMRLGISSGAALLLLLASLIGSYFNIPVAYLPEQQVLAQQEIDFFGVRYVVPFVAQWPGTLIAVNTPDAGLLAAAQAVEHYEISRYGTLKTWAEKLGMQQAVMLPDQTLTEEKNTNEAASRGDSRSGS